MVDVLILNGPNLNMLGLREPHLYGTDTLDDLNALCHATAAELGLVVECRQSNHEGQLVEWIQQCHPATGSAVRGVLINAAAYTHTSVAIHDALRLLGGIPVIEVHLSDPAQREPFRHHSYITPVAARVVSGHGVKSYVIALKELSSIFAGPQA